MRSRSLGRVYVGIPPEEPESYKEYKEKQIKMLRNELKDLLTKVDGSSLKKNDKFKFKKEIINHTLTTL